jgi:PAS domain S-box-containing protein
MSVEEGAVRLPILDDIEVPETEIANWQATVDILAEIAGTASALIMRVHPRELEVFVASDSPGDVYQAGEKAPLDMGLYCETVMSTRRELVVPNALKDPEWDHNPDIKLGMISYCGLPLTWPSGEVFGTICILDAKENAYARRTRELIERFRDSIQLGLANIYASSLARAQLHEATGALSESESLRKRCLDTTQTMMVALDEKGCVSMVNRAGQSLLGYTEAELLGRNWFAMCLPQPEGMDTVYPVFRRIMAGELEGVADYENEVLCRDGRRRLIGWRNSTVRDDDGHVVGTLGSGDDITERKRGEEEIRRLNEDLERRVTERTAQLDATNTELEAFVYSVSHDLRAPLRAVDGFTHVLLEDYASALDAEGQRLCSVISKRAVEMGELIDDLLAFSHVGRTTMQVSTVDMATMAQAVYFEITTPESRERIAFHVGPLPPIVGDPILFHQVWTNLLSNAVKFSSKQERAVIEVDAETRGGEVVYSVRDDGAGFDMQHADKLFGVFQRLHTSEEFEGTGAGLAIVQRIILRHGGRIWAEGEVGNGATFSFALGEGD